MSTLKVNRIEPRSGDSVEIIGLDIKANQPSFYTEMSGNQIVSNAVDTKVLLSSTAQRVDTGNVLDTLGKCTITADTAGVWRFTGQVAGKYVDTAVELQIVTAMIFKNGSRITSQGGESTVDVGGPYGHRVYTQTVTMVAEVSAGDEIELYGNVSYAEAGTPSTMRVNQRSTNFTGNRISS